MYNQPVAGNKHCLACFEDAAKLVVGQPLPHRQTVECNSWSNQSSPAGVARLPQISDEPRTIDPRDLLPESLGANATVRRDLKDRHFRDCPSFAKTSRS